MDDVTKNVSKYIKDRGINVANIARETGLAYSSLRTSLLKENSNRKIRGEELLKVCKFLGLDPMQFESPDHGK